MTGNDDDNRTKQSPFDPYIGDALDLVAQQGDVPAKALRDRCVAEYDWLPSFADVIVTFLRTNRLIMPCEWEPGQLQISARGESWRAAAQLMRTH
jgi:hypothetical protein